jgi:hypothetical protein
MTMMAEPATPGLNYPIRLSVQRADSQSRITNFPFFIGTMIKAFLCIPHVIILYFFQIVANLLYFIATFAILFTGKYPQGMFRFYVGYMRWSTNVNTYTSNLHDKYPPFTMDAQAEYPVSFEVDYPSELSRPLNLPILGLIIKAVLAIPHAVCLVFLGLASVVVIFIAQFAILFTGSFPEGMHRFVVGVQRWSLRVEGYIFALTDGYPPFSLE